MIFIGKQREVYGNTINQTALNNVEGIIEFSAGNDNNNNNNNNDNNNNGVFNKLTEKMIMAQEMLINNI